MVKEKIVWNDQHETILRQWGEASACYRFMHHKSFLLYKKLSLRFSLPVIVLSTITGTANFAQSTLPPSFQPAAPSVIGGLNLIAGMSLDKKATFNEYMYLPDYVYTSFKNATLLDKNKLIKKENTLLRFSEKEPKPSTISPFLVFTIIAFLGIFINYRDNKKGKRTKILDFILFFITGLIGAIIIFLWFFSSHSTAPNNLNFLWAFVPNLIIAFLLLKNNLSKWIRIYLLVLLIFMALIPLIWIAKIQVFPLAVIPLLILLFTRYLYLHKSLLASKK